MASQAPIFADTARLRGLVLAGAALALFCGLLLAFPGPFERLELSLSDLRYRAAPRPRAHPDVVLVDIDDASVRLFGKWPLDRRAHAQILDILTDCGASVVAYDIVFHGPAPSPGSDEALERAIRRHGRVVLPAGVALVREADTVRLTPDADDLPLLPSLLEPGPLRVEALHQAEKTFLPAARFSRPALGLGHIAATPDADGVFRRMPLAVGFHGRLLPALGLVAVARHLEADIQPRPGGLALAQKNGDAIVAPMGPDGLAPVNLAAPWGRGFWHLSYAELAQAADDPARLAFLKQGLAGKIVLVGLTASGTTDIKATPLSPAEPLVTLHAGLASSLLERAFLRQAPAWASALAAAALLGMAALLFLRLNIRRFLLVGPALALAYPAANVALYAASGLALNLTAPTLALLIFTLTLLAHGLARTAGEAARQRRMLEVYFSPAIARQIMGSGADIMEGRGVDLSVLFSDIAGFTAMSDHMEPAEVQRFLGEYFEEMTACVFRHGGAVDKFMGDGLMAFFGYPEAEGLESTENARRSAIAAVACAVDMQAAVKRLNSRWASQGRQPIAIRIGINTGHCVVGDMGSASRREFTLLGRNVNLAQRLESNAPRGGILLSARTAALSQDHFAMDPPRSLSVKGFDKDVETRAVRLGGE